MQCLPDLIYNLYQLQTLLHNTSPPIFSSIKPVYRKEGPCTLLSLPSLYIQTCQHFSIQTHFCAQLYIDTRFMIIFCNELYRAQDYVSSRCKRKWEVWVKSLCISENFQFLVVCICNCITIWCLSRKPWLFDSHTRKIFK